MGTALQIETLKLISWSWSGVNQESVRCPSGVRQGSIRDPSGVCQDSIGSLSGVGQESVRKGSAVSQEWSGVNRQNASKLVLSKLSPNDLSK